MNRNVNLREKKNTIVNRTDAINSYLRNINKYKVLSTSEETELFKRLENGDESAREAIINHNQRFVFAIAKTYASDERVLDLVGEGTIGLIQAIDTYDYKKGNRFLSYAVWYIRRSINAYIMNNDVLIRKTNSSKTNYHINKIKSRFYAENGRYPTENEMIDLLKERGIQINEEGDLYDLKVNSISTTYDDEDGNAFENSSFFTSKTSVRNEYETEMDNEFFSEYAKVFLAALDERERTIIEYSCGIGKLRQYSNSEIADIMDMSVERVRQIRNTAIAKMRSVHVSVV